MNCMILLMYVNSTLLVQLLRFLAQSWKLMESNWGLEYQNASRISLSSRSEMAFSPKPQYNPSFLGAIV